QNILFEGAQSTLLDIVHGIYPYNTSSTCIVAGASSGSGIGIQYLNERIGVVKAFTSRVGAGPVMGELDIQKNPGKILQIEGKEFGTTTGRPRRMAWLDIVALRYSCRINGFTGLAITKLDILGILKFFSVISSYKNNETQEEIFSCFPAQLSKFSKIKPVLKEFKGWGHYSREKWLAMMEKGFQSFPSELKEFLNFLETETETPIYLIGVGPDRELTFELKSLDWI
ncbi:MAG: adenylosuccinate synthetase, partial [Candidatus Heimdallarchaeota archaeon]